MADLDKPLHQSFFVSANDEQIVLFSVLRELFIVSLSQLHQVQIAVQNRTTLNIFKERGRLQVKPIPKAAAECEV